MAIDSDIFTADHTLVEADWGETVQYDGANVAAVIDDLEDSDALGLSSVTEERRVNVSVRRSLLTRTPRVGDRITVRGEALTVDRITDSGDGVSWVLACVGESQ